MGKITTKELAKYAVNQIMYSVESSTLAQQIAAFLLEERKSREMPAVMRAIEEELSRLGSKQITITAAHAVSDETKKQLAQLLEVKSPVFTEIIDESVIGGVKARSDETEIDLTLRGRLNRFKTRIVKEA